ncbi:Alpha/beta hydrolase [Leifsonia sp. CL147]|nr:Alpha/beta hydrolase [Leifsonia sp. CL154]SFL35990.1 Alpha/beta hydrolase [Leifsonia sp. CL147]
MAEWLWHRADRLAEVVERVGEPYWSGEAATVFGERLGSVSLACRATSKRFSEARDASHRWASAMWGSQGAADAALQAAEEALEDIASAEASLSALSAEHAAVLAALALLERTQKQYAATPPPPGTHVPTGSDVAAARRHADDANLELRFAQSRLEDAQERLERARIAARDAEEQYDADETVFVRALEATLHGAMPAVAPGELSDFVTTVSAFARVGPPTTSTVTAAATSSVPAPAEMGLLTLTPRELSRMLARDPQLVQKLWDKPPRAETAATWWKNLSPELREQWCQSAPAVIGNLPGLDADTRIHANAIQLQRDLNDSTISPTSAQGKTLTDILKALGIHKIEGGTALDYEKLAKAQKPPRGLLSYNLRHDPPLAAVAIGDTNAEKSGKVTWMVPGMNSKLGEPGRLEGWAGVTLDVYKEQQGLERGVAHMVVAWIGYEPPGNDSVGQGDRARAGAARLSRELDGQWAADSILGDNPTPFTSVMGHSYGTTVIGNAVSDLAHNVQSVVLLASAGVEQDLHNVKSLHVDGGGQHVYASQSSQDHWADTGRGISGRLDPRDRDFGARGFSSEGDPAHKLQPVDGHDVIGHGNDTGNWFNPMDDHASKGHGYLDKDTEALHNAAAAALGLDGKINGGASKPGAGKK